MSADVMQPDRQYSLQEVAAHCGLASYVVRYWEIHFPQLAGSGNGTKTFYTNNDIALIFRIKKLLYVDHLTIEQAKTQLAAEQAFPVQYPDVGSAIQTKAESETGVKEESEIDEKPADEHVTKENSEAVVSCDSSEAERSEEVVEEQTPAVEETQEQKETASADLESGNCGCTDEPNEAPCDAQPSVDASVLENLKEELHALREEMASLREENETLKQEMTSLEEKLAVAERARCACEAKESDLQSENDRLAEQVKTTISQLNELVASFRKI